VAELEAHVADVIAQREAELRGEQVLWSADISTLRQGYAASRLVDSVMESLIRERDVAQFLGRMNMHEDYADEMNHLRSKRRAENRQFWQDRRRAEQERRDAAAARTQSLRIHHTLQCRNESLLVREAVEVQKAKVRLAKRLVVEEHHRERMTKRQLLGRGDSEGIGGGGSPLQQQQQQQHLNSNSNSYARKKVIEALYSRHGRWAAAAAAANTDPPGHLQAQDECAAVEDYEKEEVLDGGHDRSSSSSAPEAAAAAAGPRLNSRGGLRDDANTSCDDDEDEFEIEDDNEEEESDDARKKNADVDRSEANRHRHQEDQLKCNAELLDESTHGGATTTLAYVQAELEHRKLLRWRRRLPQVCPVLAPQLRSNPPSLSYPTSKNISQCKNPEIATTAAKLLKLEVDRAREVRAQQLAEITKLSSEKKKKKESDKMGGVLKQQLEKSNATEIELASRHLSDVARQEAFNRLTQRSVTEDARLHAKLEDAKPRTFHDHLAPVYGCNARLYSNESSRDLKHQLLSLQEEQGDYNSGNLAFHSKNRHHQADLQRPLQYWGEHFYGDAVRRHNMSLDSLQQVALMQSSVATIRPATGGRKPGGGPGGSEEEGEEEPKAVDVNELVKRLTQTKKKENSSSPLPNRIGSAAAVSGRPDDDRRHSRRASSAADSRHVDRFYTKALVQERQTFSELDARYKVIRVPN
jgi:hypothetical protein